MIVKTKTGASSTTSSYLLGQIAILAVIFLFGAIVGHFHGKFSLQQTVGTFSTTSRRWELSTTSITGERSNSDVAETARKMSPLLESEDDTNQSAGWRAVHVFFGDTKRHLQAALEAINATDTTWFANHKQDQLVLGLLRNKQGGFFVDLAAGDAINNSITLGLEVNAQWSGLCIEPNPLYWYGLSYYRRCQLVAAVVGMKHMEQMYFRYSNYQREYFGGGVPKK
jgi:hypothetical protein